MRSLAATLLLAGLAVSATSSISSAQSFWNPTVETDARPTGAVTKPFDAGNAVEVQATTLAQAMPSQQPTAAPEGQAPATAATEVDESALRYFARRGDTRRLEIEIARLRALYPNWRPPEDPLAVPVNVDEQLENLWRLYSEGKFAEARRLIAERQEAETSWQPPADLLDRLALAESRERLINASNLDQYETVIRIGSDNPHLLTCSEVDVLWRVAEAFAQTDRKARARDAYRYILTNCDDAQERVATMQNAKRLLDGPMIDELLALERFNDAGEGEFATVRDDIARDAVAAGGEDPAMVVASEALSRVERLAREGQAAADAKLLGWYNLRRENFDAARRWFALAQEREPESEAAQGLALALIGLNQFAEAEAAAFPYRESGDDNSKVYFAAAANLLGQEPRVALSSEVLTRIVAAAVAARNVATARQLGWYSRAYNQHETAGRWFAAALAYDPDDEPAAYGLALTYQQLARRADLAEIKRVWAGRSARIQAVGTPAARDERQATPPPAAAAEPLAYQAEPARPRQAVPNDDAAPAPAANSPAPSRTERSAPPRSSRSVARQPARSSCRATDPAIGTLSAQAALNRGWCLMDLDRPHEAAQAFERALATSSEAVRRDASYGQSLAYLRLGLVDEAAVAAAKARQSGNRASELQGSILAERALAYFEKGRYVEAILTLDQRAAIAPERVDLMVLRGYAYLNLKRTGDAMRVFQAAAGTGDRDAMKGLAIAREATP